MNVGWVGLGKLGLPCALVLATEHNIRGTDVNPEVRSYLSGQQPIPYVEEGVQEALDEGRGRDIWVDTIEQVVEHADVVFVAVQTPHAPEYGGGTPLPDTREDFDYSYLVSAVREICVAADHQKKIITLVVVSTVLPGTTERFLAPLTSPYVQLVYSPSFIAMGTAMKDFANPEMVLVGGRGMGAAEVRRVFGVIHDAPVIPMSIASAELTKVAYNTFIGAKIVYANTLMEICHKTGADVDEVSDALALATRRVISPAYMRGGMGDGGGCHPRDNIALSWLAERLGLSYDLFGELMRAREAQTGWLAELVGYHAEVSGLSVVVLGKAYKAGSNLTLGSPAMLLARMIKGGVRTHYDPHVDGKWTTMFPGVFVIATNHPEFQEFKYPRGSIVIDPWGYIEDRPGVVVVRVGRK